MVQLIITNVGVQQIHFCLFRILHRLNIFYRVMHVLQVQHLLWALVLVPALRMLTFHHLHHRLKLFHRPAVYVLQAQHLPLVLSLVPVQQIHFCINRILRRLKMFYRVMHVLQAQHLLWALVLVPALRILTFHHLHHLVLAVRQVR